MALAVGATIPPFYIFPCNNMQNVFMDNAAPGVANRSGWMTSVEFVKFIAHLIKHAHATRVADSFSS